VQEAQHSTVRISKVSSFSANSQSQASNNQTFQSWIMLKGFDEFPQMNVLLCMLNDMFATEMITIRFAGWISGRLVGLQPDTDIQKLLSNGNRIRISETLLSIFL